MAAAGEKTVREWLKRASSRVGLGTLASFLLGLVLAYPVGRELFFAQNGQALERDLGKAVGVLISTGAQMAAEDAKAAVEGVRGVHANLREVALTVRRAQAGRVVEDVVWADPAELASLPLRARQIPILHGPEKWAANVYYAARPERFIADRQRLMLLATSVLLGLTFAAAHDASSQLRENRRRLAEERSAREREAVWVTLSRKVGHDLTSILAAGDVSLQTMETALGSVPDGQRGAGWYLSLKRQIDLILHINESLRHEVGIYRDIGRLAEPRVQETDVGALVSEEVEYQRHIRQKVTYELEVPGQGLVADVEPRLLRVALINLLDNAACAAMRGEGDAGVSVQLRPDDALGGFVIEVCDNGPGIRNLAGRRLADEEIDLIFQPDYSTKDSGEGGYGLYWVRSIVEEIHGGVLSARNSSGAVFSMWIPQAADRTTS